MVGDIVLVPFPFIFYSYFPRSMSSTPIGERESREFNMTPCVYILSSKRNGTLYIGVTSNLVQRVWQHRNNFVEGFTKRYGVHTLVWYEMHSTMYSAITRERALKKWNRSWKVDLIEENNPTWRDLYSEIV